MTTSSALGSCRKVVPSSLTELVKLCPSRESIEEFEISSVNMRELLGRVMEADTASSQQFVDLPKSKMESGRPQIFAAISAATDHALMSEAGMEQVSQLLIPSTVVQTYAAKDVRVTQKYVTLFREKSFPPFFLNGSTCLSRALIKKKTAANISLLY